MAVAESHLGFILFVSCLLILPGCKSSQEHFNKHTALFIFGDSLFDAGNNDHIDSWAQFRAKFWPYGESFFNSPTGRFTDGRTIPDFIAEFAGLPLIPVYLDPHNDEFRYGANFASAGSGALVETNAGFVTDLQTQLQYLFDLEKQFRKKLGDAETERLLSDAVYLFNSGCNDYSAVLEAAVLENNQSSINYEDLMGMIIGNLTENFKGIHEIGGRKFGFSTIGPLGCSPSARARMPDYACMEEFNTIASLHNQELSKKLQELALQLEGFKYAYYDHYTSLSERMNNPSKYGFKVGDSACCGSGPFRGSHNCGGQTGEQEFELCDNPNDYVFFDAAHPSEAANHQLAERFWSGDPKVTSPYNLKAFFSGGWEVDSHEVE